MTALYGRGVARRATGDRAQGDADVADALRRRPKVLEDFPVVPR